MDMTSRLAVDAHFHGHNGTLLLAGYSFAEITWSVRQVGMAQLSLIKGLFAWFKSFLK